MSLSKIENESGNAREDRAVSESEFSPDSAGWVHTLERMWDRRYRVGLWMALGFVISILLAIKYCKFEATVQLMPPDGASSGLGAQLLPMLSKLPGANVGGSAFSSFAGDILGGKNSTALFAKVLQSRTIEDSLIDRFQLRKRYWRRYNEDARKDLESNISIEEDKKSGILTIVVRDKDAQMASDMANAYVTELDRVIAKVATSAARRERLFIEQRLEDEKKALQDAEQRFSQFSSGSMVLDVPEQIKVTVESAARLQGDLIAARAELEGLRKIYSPENNRIVSLTARLAELESQLRKMNSGRPDPGGVQDPTFPYPSVKNLPVLGVQWANLYRDSKIHEVVFETLTQQYEMARIQEAKEIPTVKVLDPAILPEKRHPRPSRVILLGTILSAVLACCGVILQEQGEKWETWAKSDLNDPRRIMVLRVFTRVHAMLSKVRRHRTADESDPLNLKQS